MTFWPITVEDPNQLGFEELQSEQPPYPSLQERLRKKYAGRTLTFLELLNDDYPHDIWVEKQYRAALKDMEKAEPPGVEITRAKPVTPKTGLPAKGLDHPDTLRFPGPRSQSGKGAYTGAHL
jgi:hypothetical protein